MELNDLFSLQIFTVLVLFVVSLCGAFVPLRLKTVIKGDLFNVVLSLANSATVGIFLATGLGHMYGHCAMGLNQSGFDPEESLQYASMFCLSGFMLTLFIEKVALAGHGHDHNSLLQTMEEGKSNVPTFLAIVLAVHGVLEGIAMGVERTVGGLRVVLFGMIPHKFFTGMALGISLLKYSLHGLAAAKIAGAWATATPGGILLGMVLVSGFRRGVDSALQGIASGTFLYISICEILHEEFSIPARRSFNAAKIAAVLAGMAVAFWLEGGAHDHSSGAAGGGGINSSHHSH